MAIISVSKKTAFRGYGNTQFRYAMTYVVITFVVLLVLNIYCSNITQTVFYVGKESSMIEKCQIASDEIANLDVLNSTTVANLVSQMESLKVTRMIVTDQAGMVLYDSREAAVGSYTLFPEIMKALSARCNNVFTCHYADGALYSKAATPIVYYGNIIGCVLCWKRILHD